MQASLCQVFTSSVIVWILVFGALTVFSIVLVRSLRRYINPTSAEEKKDFVQLIFHAVGGMLVILGVYVTWQEFKTSRAALVNSQETLRTTQEGQITDRFTRAIEQLGKSDDVSGKTNNLAIRLGGIYSLERLARDSLDSDQSPEKNKGKSDHWVIVEILTTYIAKNSQWTAEKEKETTIPPLPADIQAILTVLGRRNLSYQNGETQIINLRGTDLRAANLSTGNFNGADFEGSHLEEAELNGASLNDASLTYVSLKGAFLNAAQLKNANLQGADMSNAELNRANLFGSNLTGAGLANADLSGADLTCAMVEPRQLNLARLSPETKLPNPQMKCPSK